MLFSLYFQSLLRITKDTDKGILITASTEAWEVISVE